MAKSKPYFFAILATNLEEPRSGYASPMALRGFLDMLRYDRAIIHKIEGGMYILQTERPPTEARWNSFGIAVWNVTRDDWDTITRTRAEAPGLVIS